MENQEDAGHETLSGGPLSASSQTPFLIIGHVNGGFLAWRAVSR